MSRKLICDFCFEEFPDHNADVDTGKRLNWVEQLDKTTDVCAECAMLVIHSMVEHGGYDPQTIGLMRHGKFPEPAVKPCEDDGEDLDFDPEDTPLDFGPDDVAVAMGEAAKVVAARAVEAKLFGPEPNPDATINDVFHLTMHGAGLNPEHELLFQTVDEAKDYAAKNAQVFPEASYFLTCPDGVVLQGVQCVAWSPGDPGPEPGDFKVAWKVAGKAAPQPKKP